MNRFVAEIREMANAIGSQQGREIPVMARVDLEKEKNLSMGLDVETWLKEGSINYVVGQDPYVLTETQPKPRWMPDAANAAGAASVLPPTTTRV